ncbi:uncharacterized protein LOC144167369 [Haemaphysalis longicornis]
MRRASNAIFRINKYVIKLAVCITAFCFAVVLPGDIYHVGKLKNVKERVYVLFKNYGTNEFYHCQSGQIIYRKSAWWNVTLRWLPPGKEKLNCYNTRVNVSASEDVKNNPNNYRDLLTFSALPHGLLFQRQVIFQSSEENCWVTRDLNRTNSKGRRECELLVKSSAITTRIPTECVANFKRKCGDTTPGSYITGCKSLEDDELSCGPRPTTPRPTTPPVTVTPPSWCPKF